MDESKKEMNKTMLPICGLDDLVLAFVLLFLRFMFFFYTAICKARRGNTKGGYLSQPKIMMRSEKLKLKDYN